MAKMTIVLVRKFLPPPFCTSKNATFGTWNLENSIKERWKGVWTCGLRRMRGLPPPRWSTGGGGDSSQGSPKTPQGTAGDGNKALGRGMGRGRGSPGPRPRDHLPAAPRGRGWGRLGATRGWPAGAGWEQDGVGRVPGVLGSSARLGGWAHPSGTGNTGDDDCAKWHKK